MLSAVISLALAASCVVKADLSYNWTVLSGHMLAPNCNPAGDTIASLISAGYWASGSKGYIFGGYTACHDWNTHVWEYTLYEVDLATGAAQLLSGQYSTVPHDESGVYGPLGVPISGGRPSGRFGVALWLTGTEDYLVAFGGIAYDLSEGTYGAMSDMWNYSLATGLWTWIFGDSIGPDPNFNRDCGGRFPPQLGMYGNDPGFRFMPGTSSNGTHLFIYSGSASHICYNDVWAWNVATQLWAWVAGTCTSESFDGQYPVACGGENVASRGSGDMWIFGGTCGVTQLFFWNATTSAFHNVGGNQSLVNAYIPAIYSGPFVWPGGRSNAAFVVVDAGLLLVGGSGARNASTGLNNDLGLNDQWFFSFSTLAWEFIAGWTDPSKDPSTIVTGGSIVQLSQICGAAAFSYGNKLILVSGYVDSTYPTTAVYSYTLASFNTCPAGTYYAENSSRCVSCPVGTWSGMLATACTQCAPGSYAQVGGLVACSLCPRGKFSATAGAVSCPDCPKGTYTPASGQPCVSCAGNGTTYLTGSVSESLCVCPAGFYGEPFLGAICKFCAQSMGVSCPWNSSFPWVNAGWARDPADAANAFQCIPDVACPETGDALNTTCAAGYLGTACSVCGGSTFRQGSYCKSCPSVPGIAVLVVVILLAFAAVVFLVYKSKGQLDISPRVRLMVVWVQFLGTLSNISSSWPSTLLSFLNVLSLTNMNIEIFSTDCSVRLDFFSKFLVKMLIPPVAWAGLLVANVIGNRLKFNGKSLAESIIDRAEPLAVSCITAFYTLIAQAAIQPLQCVQQPNGRYSLSLSPDIYCFEGEWLVHLGLFVTSWVIYLIVIPFYLVWLYVRMSHQSTTRKRFLFLVRKYKTAFQWWEVVSIIKRTVLVFTATVLTQGDFRGFLALFLLIGFLTTESLVVPYKTLELQRASVLWMSASLLVLSIGVLFQSATVSAGAEVLLTVFVILLVVGLVALSCLQTVLQKIGRMNPSLSLLTDIPGNDITIDGDRVTMIVRDLPRICNPVSGCLDLRYTLTEGGTALAQSDAVLSIDSNAVTTVTGVAVPVVGPVGTSVA